MIEHLVKADLEGVQIRHVRMGFSADISQVGRLRLSKLFRLLTLVVKIAYNRVRYRPRILYYPPAGPNRVPMFRDFAILLATRWMFPATVFHFHASGLGLLYESLPKWQQAVFRVAYFDPAAVIRISSLAPEDGKALRAKREYIVPNGIAHPRGANPLRRPSDDDLLRVLFVGILMEPKGVLTLVEAARILVDRGLNLRVEFMGQFDDPTFADTVNEAVSEYGLEDRIGWLGQLQGDAKWAVFESSDVLCHPTRYDTAPVVILEAMATGLPVVSTRHSGIPSMVDDGVTGLLVEPGNPTALADALLRLAQDKELRHAMGTAGQQRFEQEFTLAAHIEALRKVFLDVARSVGPGGEA